MSTLNLTDYYRSELAVSALNKIGAVAITTLDGQILDISTLFVKMSGHSRESLLEKKYFELGSEGYERPFYDKVLQQLAKGKPWGGEVRHLSRSKFHYWLETHATPDLDSNCIFWFSFDITERKSVEQALGDSEKFIRTLMNVAPTGIFVTDANGKISYSNRMWLSLTNQQSNTIVGSIWLDAIHQKSRTDASTAWSHFVASDSSLSLVLRLKNEDGSSERFVAVSGTKIISLSGNAVSFLCMTQDITELKTKEHLILDQQAVLVATSKMSALGEMAGGMAHEINTPLGVIKIRSHQIRRLTSQPEFDVESVKKMTSAIESATDYISKIIQGLRTFSRNSQSDPMADELLSTVIHDTTILCSQTFSDRGIDFSVADIPNVYIKCRPSQIAQVFVNILNNACDATSALAEKWINISFQMEDNNIRIFITDSGAGISKEVEKKLFQPFFTTKAIGSGTGLGLSISRGIIEEHGGSLTIAQPFPNTRFVIDLPVYFLQT